MRILLALGGLLLAACAQSRPPTIAIRGVTIVDVMDGSLRAEHTVLVTGNRIAAVGAVDQVRVPGTAEVIDAAGAFLIPGLWDMHVHSVANVAWDRGVGSVSNADWHFPLFLAYGVTGVRNMNDGTADPTLELTRSVERRLTEGSRLLADSNQRAMVERSPLALLRHERRLYETRAVVTHAASRRRT
jgi:alpha-D-ribose 1-methylphosphonate 5-triphosphate diphosphatase PhnM